MLKRCFYLNRAPLSLRRTIVETDLDPLTPLDWMPDLNLSVLKQCSVCEC